MTTPAQDLAHIADQLASIQDRLKAQLPGGGKALDLLSGIEASLAEAAEALVESVKISKADQAGLADLVKAVRALKFEASAVQVSTPAPTVNVSVPQGPAPIVNVEASQSWTSIEITPRRDPLTGEARSYIIKRLS
jgi:hypothetical protein